MNSFKGRVLTALRWTVIFRFSGQLLSWLITIVVIRLLDPSDYGLMAMSQVVFSLLLVISPAGVGTALIQAKAVDEVQVRQLFGFLLLLNGALFATLVGFAPIIAAFFGQPRVSDLCRVLAVGFLLIPFITIPSALLTRQLEMKQKAGVDFGANFSAGVVTLILAYSGFGVWSLVIGRILSLAFSAIGMNIVRPCLMLPRFSFKAIRPFLKFGGTFTVTTIVWSMYSRMDIVIGGRVLSVEALGYYTIALNLASLVLDRTMPLLNEIAMSSYSRFQDDRRIVGHYFRKIMRMGSLVVFPLVLGLGSVAPEFTHLMLGPRYGESIVPLALMALVMPIRLVGNLYSTPVYAMGRPGVELGNKVFALCIMSVAFAVGVNWGIIGLCGAWLVGSPIALTVQMARSGRVIGVRVGQVAQDVAPNAIAASLMVGVVVAVRTFLPVALPMAGHLVALVLAGAGSYGALTWMFNRAQIIEMRDALRSDRG